MRDFAGIAERPGRPPRRLPGHRRPRAALRDRRASPPRRAKRSSAAARSSSTSWHGSKPSPTRAAGHAARIAAKRLRYLAEPVAPWIDAARRPVELLKELQDLLGELHDGQLLAAQVAHALAEIESKRAQRLIEADPRRAGSASRRRRRSDCNAASAPGSSPWREGSARGAASSSAPSAQDWLGETAPRRQELATALAELDQALATPPRRRAARTRPASRY